MYPGEVLRWSKVLLILSMKKKKSQARGRIQMTQSAYDCKKPNIEVADILREHIPDYLAKYRMPPEHYKVVYDILNCRTAYLGGHIEECDHCGTKRNAYNSCSNRHCPKCQTITKEKWLEARKAELLPVPYFHSVFTLPHDLNPVILCNKKVMLRILFKAVSINKRTPKDFSHSIPPSLLF